MALNFQFPVKCESKRFTNIIALLKKKLINYEENTVKVCPYRTASDDGHTLIYRCCIVTLARSSSKKAFEKLLLLRFSDRHVNSGQSRLCWNSWQADLKQTVLSRQLFVQIALYTDQPVAEPL